MKDQRKMIFVLGTGRSGTCWVGNVLGRHPEIKSFVETRPVFDWVTHVAVDSGEEDEYLPKIFAEYERLYSQAQPFHFADKSHPALWIAEKLADRFPGSYFLGVTRDVVQTVASMKRHSGVRRWCEEWEKYRVPNRFLGITAENLGWYQQASLVERCTARWLSHQHELIRLQERLKGSFYLLRYEQLVSATESTMSDVRCFLGLQNDFPESIPTAESLTKWQSELSPDDLLKIQSALSVLGKNPPSLA